MLKPVYRFFSHFMPILTSIIIITGILLTSIMLPSPRSAHAVGVGFSACRLTIQNTDPSLQDIAQRHQIAFAAVCPLLVKRFALRSDIASNVTLTFSSKLPPDAEPSAASNRIEVSSAFLRKRPYEAIGSFIRELTYVIQNAFNDTSWFSWAMGDYARSIYGPKDDNWNLPLSVMPTASLLARDTRTGAAFLHWLQQRTTLTLVDQLNRVIQTKQSFPAAFQRLTGGTVDQLWKKYKANPDLVPFQRFPAPDGSTASKSLPCKLTIQNSNSSSLEEFAQRYQTAFQAACPLLVKRFARRPDIANNVTLTFSSKVSPDLWGFAREGSIIVNINAIRADPRQDVTTLIHELAHIIQNYDDEAPFWFLEGMADYAAEVYRPADQLSPFYDFEDPEKYRQETGDSYTQGYWQAARFLVWLEQHTTPTIVDQLNRAIQTGPFFSETFKRLTHGTEDELWNKYKANSKLGPVQRVIIPD